MKNKARQLVYRKVAEMEGFSDLNMHNDAVELAKQILSDAALDTFAFSKSLMAIFVSHEDIENLKDLVQAAYDRLSGSDQRKARHLMLDYYRSIKDMKTAMNYIATPTNGAELHFVMEVLLANDRLDEAEKLFFRGRNKLKGIKNVFDWSMVFAAMARYCERTGKLNEAEQYWLQVSELDQPVLQDALSGLVKIQIVRAWNHLQRGLAQIEKFKNNMDPSAVMLPGNHDKLLADARKELESYREALGKIVPEKDLGWFGVK